MVSLRHSTSVASAVCKQTAVSPLRLRSSPSVASFHTCNAFSTLCLPARQPVSYSRLESSQQPTSSQARLPFCQTRTFLTQLRRQAQALREQSAAPSAPSDPVTQAESQPQPPLQLKNLPYFVRRTASNQLPIYLVTKAGGTKQLTKIQKTEGDLDALRRDLALALGAESSDSRSKSSDVTINRLNGHIIVKGWRKPEILKFLQERNF